MEQDPHHDKLIALFMKHFLSTPGLFNRYKTNDIYPVVLGGIDVIRCCQGFGTTADIDIKFVVSPKIVGKEDPNFRLACALRDRFLAELLQIANDSKMLGPTTILTVSEVDQKMPSARVVVYEEINNNKQIFIDTGIFSNMSMYMYENFANFFPHKLIPTFVDNHIPFATCSWTLVDTVRMLHYCKEQFKISNHAQFWKKKYLKYLGKFNILYHYYNGKSEMMHQLFRSIPEAEEYLSTQTNIERIKEQFIAKPDLETCFKLVLNHVQEKTLPKYFMSHVDPAFYPILIGGVVVEKCVKSMFKLNINDIDIQFIVKDADQLNRVARSKKRLSEEILTDPELGSFIVSLESQFGYKIDLASFSDWDENHPHQKEMGLIIIEITFKEPDSGLLLSKKNMIDICIFDKQPAEIPFEKINDVLYATCDFTFINTEYMIQIYQDRYINVDGKKRQSLNKYLRYVCKYCALYMVKHRDTIPERKMKRLRDLYKKLSHIIRGRTLKDGSPEKQVFKIVESIKEETEVSNF